MEQAPAIKVVWAYTGTTDWKAYKAWVNALIEIRNLPQTTEQP